MTWPKPDEWAAERLQNLDHVSLHILTLMQSLLPVAVANLVDQIRHEDWEERQARLRIIRSRWESPNLPGGGYCSFDESLLFPVKGRTRQAFAELAEIIAIMSFCPGGVRAFGLHWESHHDDCGNELCYAN